ncbi:hypothetical protein [Phenylobacterium sp.]|uniref:hypothetical protein n=1 Tax=Phenylobacterium sp. TaxID=1871053 RepID=UPI003D29E73E
MKLEMLLSILLLGGCSGTCLAQEVVATIPPSAATDGPPTPATEEASAKPAEPTAPTVAPDAPLVAYSGSMTTIMTAMSPGKAAFAIVGAAAMIAEGKQIIADNQIIDPSQGIAREVATDFAQARSARVADAPLGVERKGATVPKPAALAAAATGAAYVVDVDSGWILSYFPVDWAKYKVIFISNMRLVDAKSLAVVAKQSCSWDGEKRGDPKFTRDELLNDNAKGLKDALARGASFCAGEFKAKVAATVGAGDAPKAAGS